MVEVRGRPAWQRVNRGANGASSPVADFPKNLVDRRSATAAGIFHPLATPGGEVIVVRVTGTMLLVRTARPGSMIRHR